MSTPSNHLASQRWRRHRAARVVAGQARNAEELVELLDMLGLTAEEGRRPAPPTVNTGPIPAPRHASAAERDLATTLLATVSRALR
jgi:hypothetical protein